MTTTWMPKVVRETLDDATAKTGTEPRVEQTTPHLFKLIMDNGRVYMVGEFHYNAVVKKWRWTKSLLLVDGVKRNILPPEEFYRVFNGGAYPGDEEPATEPSQLPAKVDPDTAPAEVRLTVDQMMAKIATDRGGEISVHHAADDPIWVLAFETERLQMRFRYRTLRGRCGLDKFRPIELWADGVDRSEEAQGDIAKAMKIAAGSSTAVKSSGPQNPGGSSAPATRAKSVEVRNTTVIRN